MGSSTAVPPANRARLLAFLPWVGLAVWAAGTAGWLLIARRYGWSVGEIMLVGCVWLIVLLAGARDAVRDLFGPVFLYEIRRLGRRRNTFLFRWLYVVAVCGLLMMVYISWLESIGHFQRYAPEKVSTLMLANFAARFYDQFALLQFVTLAFLTPGYVAGAIADEKERKTLEFLFATDLRNREIVFGKLAARVALLLMFVLAGLPVLAFLQLFGGIDPEMLLGGTAATLVTVLGLSAWSICVSSLCRRARDAISRTYLSVAAYVFGSVVLVYFVWMLTKLAGYGPVSVFGRELDLNDFAVMFGAGNPLVHFFHYLAARAAVGPTWLLLDVFIHYVLWWAVVSFIFLLIAVLRLRAVSLRQAVGAVPRRKELAARHRPRVGVNPVLWREVYVEGRGRRTALGSLMTIVFAGILFAIPVYIFVNTFGDLNPWLRYQLMLVPRGESFEARWRNFGESMSVWVRVATGSVGALLLIAVALRGASAISRERDRDTWISLIGTPLSTRDILFGKWWGCVLGPRRLYYALFAIWGIGFFSGAYEPIMLPFLLLAVGLYVTAFSWLGMYFSLTSRTSLIANTKALAASLFLLGGFWGLFGMCCGIVGAYPGEVEVNFALILLGGTPPIILGWLPIHDFTVVGSMSPFGFGRYGSDLGYFAPLLASLAWAVFAWITRRICIRHFRAKANRDD